MEKDKEQFGKVKIIFREYDSERMSLEINGTGMQLAKSLAYIVCSVARRNGGIPVSKLLHLISGLAFAMEKDMKEGRV